MSWKLAAHTLLCGALAWLMWSRIVRTRCETALLYVALWLGAAPFLYRIFRFPLLFPRVTIHGAQLALLALVVLWFATHPKGSRENLL